MIDKFKIGKYYKWIGPNKERPADWSPQGLMDFLLTGRWFECIDAFGDYQATFKTGNYFEETEWSFYGHLKYFIEANSRPDKNGNFLLF